MAKAYYCNGCDELVQGKPAAEIDTTLLRGDVELCLGCVRDFKAKYRGPE